MAVPTAITDLSATIASNSPAGGDTVFPELDNYLRAAFGFIRQGDTKASDVASAATTNIGAAAGRVVDVTGTTTITSFGTVAAGIWRIVRFTGALTLTHNATSLILPGSANITTGAGDCAIAVSLGSGNWVVTHYQPKVGYPPKASPTFTGTTTVDAILVNAAAALGGAKTTTTQDGAAASTVYSSNHKAASGTRYHFTFYEDGVERGNITSDGTNVSFNTISDVRMKNNIRQAPDSGTLIDAINVVQFDWNSTGETNKYGVIAQELVTHAPFAVSVGDGERPWGVDYSKLVPLIIKEVKALRQRVSELEK